VIIPKKGSRRIQVDGRAYAWRIRKRPTYGQAVLGGTMRVAIQSESGGATLVVDLDIQRPDSWIAPVPVSVTPAIVQKIVATALAAGWEPEVPGPAMALVYSLAAGSVGSG
jgi:hypothetical protein